MKYFIPSFVWTGFVILYLSTSVGLDNLFAQLPWEVFGSLFMIFIIPTVNYVAVMLLKENHEPGRHTRSHQLAEEAQERLHAKFDEATIEVGNAIPVERLDDGIYNLIKSYWNKI